MSCTCGDATHGCQGNEAFEKWWANQRLIATALTNPYLARSVFPGDQKIAFNAGQSASSARIAELEAENNHLKTPALDSAAYD